MTQLLDNYVLGDWRAPKGDGQVLVDAVTGEDVAAISTEGFDLAEVLAYGRSAGQASLRKMTFHERAQLLKEMALALNEVKDELYDLSFRTGATQRDSMIDIDGGIGTLFAYSGKGRREMPNADFVVEGGVEHLSKDGSFIGQHLATPMEGVAVHINAFNFPVWGLLEKFAPAFVAGVPVVTKPAPQTAYLSERMVRHLLRTGLVPDGALQLLLGEPRDLLDHVGEQDLVSVTGSAHTTRKLRAHPAIVQNSTRFMAEADSLNAAVLGPDATPETPEFDLYVREVVREMTAKAGQKCTAIRRVFVPRDLVEPVTQAIQERLARTVVGDPRHENTRMGALVSLAQREAVLTGIEQLAAAGTVLCGPEARDLNNADPEVGAFVAPTLLLAEDPTRDEPHLIEAFGPVSTVLPYDTTDEAVELVKRGRGSLVASVFTADPDVARDLVRGIANHHGRVLVVDRTVAKTSTGHGSPLPPLVHGGPGRAGGSEELGGIRSIHHYLQRTAVQGSPELLTAIAGRYMPGAPRSEGTHPFRKYFDDLSIGDAVVAGPRTITQEDIDAFAELTGDTFYAHTDPEAAAANPFFDGIVAHGYLVLSAAAGLFVDPDPGPVLANYGLENLRFQTPTYPGDEMTVTLTCKDKIDRINAEHGEVRWDTVVTNAEGEVLATYDVLTLVAKRGSGAG